MTPTTDKAALLTVTTAAIRFDSGLIATMPRPHRHGSLLNRTHWKLGKTEDHGFMLSDGSYADRKRAYEVAEAAGQIAFPDPEGSPYKPYSLFTEHLWSEEAHD
jgi:hypothetical protein